MDGKINNEVIDLEYNNKFTALLSKYLIPKEKPKYKYEYTELCSELEPVYGKVIWTLPHRAGFTEYKIRKAHEIAKKRGITKIGYLVGIIKKLP